MRKHKADQDADLMEVNVLIWKCSVLLSATAMDCEWAVFKENLGKITELEREAARIKPLNCPRLLLHTTTQIRVLRKYFHHLRSCVTLEGVRQVIQLIARMFVEFDGPRINVSIAESSHCFSVHAPRLATSGLVGQERAELFGQLWWLYMATMLTDEMAEDVVKYMLMLASCVFGKVVCVRTTNN